MKNKQAPAASPRQLAGFTQHKRNLVYAACGLSSRHQAQIEALLAETNMERSVGKGALRNVISLFHSRKNEATRITESHTCEQLFALELELDPDVIGYQTQVRCPGVTRILPNGRRHVSAPHVDFIVFRTGSIELVECKTLKWLHSAEAKESDWYQDSSGAWRLPPHEDWAEARGIKFVVWASDEIFAIHLRNLELIYAVRANSANTDDERVLDRAYRLLKSQPRTVQELSLSIKNFQERHAALLLARRKAFGLLKSTSLSLPDKFCLFADTEHAQMADRCAFERLTADLADPEITAPLCLASTTDLERGRLRLQRIAAIKAGEAPQTRRMASLAKAIDRAVSSGLPPLAAALTTFGNCGNRTPRLLPEQQQKLTEVIRTHWRSGAFTTRRQLHHLLKDECDLVGVPAPSISVLSRELRKLDPARQALATGGMRGYQAAQPVSDPRFRSGSALGYGHTLHIDSSDVDMRVAPEGADHPHAEKPRFYVGVDEASGEVMAFALYFGNPSSDGFAMLLREYVHRHHHLPYTIFLDRGPEQTTNWLKEFAFNHGITLRYSPTAASRFNSLAEAAIKQANMSVAHRLEGNTLKDAMGRATDGRYKSRANARTQFVAFFEAFKKYLYQHHPLVPGGDSLSPVERRDEQRSMFGMVGRPQAYDEGFLIQTSIPSKHSHRGTERHGVRTSYGTYTSDTLRLTLRTSSVEEVRRDCIDPTLMYVRAGGRWHRAAHSRVLSAQQFSEAEKVWLAADWDVRRAAATKKRQEMAEIHDREMRSQRARSANQHLRADQVDAPAPTAEVAPLEDSGTPEAIDPDTLTPFDEE